MILLQYVSIGNVDNFIGKGDRILLQRWKKHKNGEDAGKDENPSQGFYQLLFVGKDVRKTEPHKGRPTKGNGGINEGTDVGKNFVIGINKEYTSKEAPQSYGNDKIEKMFECRYMGLPISTQKNENKGTKGYDCT